MPYPNNPYDALKTLLAGSGTTRLAPRDPGDDSVGPQLDQATGPLSLNASDPNGMVHSRLRQEDIGKEMLRTRDLSASAPGRSFAGSTPSDFADLLSTLQESPNFGQDAQDTVKRTDAGNRAAILAGYGGSRDIAKDYQPDGEMSAAGAVGDGLSPMAHAGRAATATEMYKEDAPVRAATAKALAESAGRIGENKAMYDLMNSQHPGGAATQAPPRPPQESVAPPVAAGPPKSFLGRLKDFALGQGQNGPGSYNSLSDLLDAKGSALLTGVAKTPQTSAIQENLLGNAQSLAGIFPSSRAAGVLSKIAQEFQSHYGNETPASSYARISNQINDLDEANKEFDDPSFKFKLTNGRLEPQAMNQTIERAKLAVQQSRGSLIRALQQIEQLHPGINGQVPQGQLGAPPQASKYQRIPESQ